jgi:uncharacterized protein (DUF885 family)
MPPRTSLLLGSLLLACSLSPSAQALRTTASVATHNNTVALDALFAGFTDRWMAANPSAASASRYFDGEQQARLDRQITGRDAASRAATRTLAAEGIAALQAIDLSSLDAERRLSAELMAQQLQQVLDGERYEHLRFPLQQMSGVNVALPNLLTVIHPLATADNLDSYLARLALLPAHMDLASEQARAMADAGVLPPDFILDATLAQMRSFIAPAPADNPLVTRLAEGSARIDGLADAQRAAAVAKATVLVGEAVYPAWQRAIAELERQRPLASSDAGAWRLPDGAAYYAAQLRNFTSTELSAQDIHAIGLREVAALEAQMDTLLRQIGRHEGTVNARIAQLKQDLAYPDTEAGHAAIMADINAYMVDADARAAKFFDLLPRTGAIAQPYPRYRWASAAASYTAPPLDGSRPGVFQMPLRPDRLTNFGLRTLTYHEAVPGHHYQLALAVENSGVPRFRQVRAFGGTAAFSEGWALYAEQLAADDGWYDGDVQGLLGQLDAALFRARRLVADTGLHAKHWTRQQAIDYGIPPSEVDRYVVNPGQATAYMIGKLEIVRLRDKARTALGSTFDLRQFHNVVLTTGVVPLPLLEQRIDAWIAQARP